MLHIYVVRVQLVLNHSKIVNIDLSLNHMWVHFLESGSSYFPSGRVQSIDLL